MSSIQINLPAIVDRVPALQACVIAASAGTGKTYTLEHVVLDYVLGRREAVALNQMLVVTFTRRATAEMKMRLRQRLTEILAAYRRGESEAPRDGHILFEVDEAARDRVRDALDTFDDAYVHTIHAFCQRILKDYAFDNAELFDATLADEEDLFHRAFMRMVRADFARTPSNRAILRLWLHLGLDLAGLESDLNTLYNRAPSDAAKHAVTVFPRLDPRDPIVRWVDTAEERGGGEAAAESLPSEIYSDEGRVTVETLARQRFLGPVRQEIQRIKAEEGDFTYQDLLTRVWESVHDEGSDLLARLRAMFRVVLIDEFQDTDPLQWGIFERTFLRDQEPGDCGLYLIGDRKQSIYGFRGADLRTYKTATELVEGEPIALGHNYRSTSALIGAYNYIFGSDFFTPEEGEPIYADPVQPADAGLERLWPAPEASIEMFELAPRRNNRKHGSGSSSPAFREKMADTIADLVRNPPELAAGRRLRPGDIYVLTVTNKEARAMGDALRERQIPHAFYRQDGLFQTDEARHIEDLLRAVATPADRSARRRAYLTPFFAIPMKQIEAFDELDTETWGPRRQLEVWHEDAERRGMATLFKRITADSGLVRRELLVSESERRLTNYQQIFDWLLENASRGRHRIEEFAEMLALRRRDDFDEEDGESTDLQRLETDRSSVQLMTIHKSKGLEAEVVFVAGGFTGRFARKKNAGMLQVYQRPDGARVAYAAKAATYDVETQELYDEHQLVERREFQRLAYVALTRAKSKLYLPYIAAEARKDDMRLEPLLATLDRVVPEARAGEARGILVHEAFERSANQERPQPASDIALDGSMRDLLAVRRPELRFRERLAGARVMTSYSGLSDSHEGDEVELAADHRASMLPGGQEPVPGGMNGGSALHEILEFASFPTAAEELIPGAETEATEAVSETLEAYSLDPNRFGAHARWVVRDALSAPLDATACGGPQLAPLRTRADDATRREVRFVVPIPEAEHRWIGKQPAGPLSVHRGYIEGFIDLIFHDGETIYFADWKSDSLIVGGDYAPETLERHVRSRYAIQANLYTLALTRMLGITDKDEYDRRIGGFFYLFVRGMRSEPQHAGRGIYFDRLSWEGLQQLEARVADRSIALQDAFSTPEHAHAAH